MPNLIFIVSNGSVIVIILRRLINKNSHPNIGYLYHYKYKVATLVA
jgi:hypothetical protein